MGVSVSHPNRETGANDELIGRDELRTLTEPWIAPVGIRFPAPVGEDAADRLEEARAAVRDVLDEVVASANEAGWATREITVALIEAVQSLGDANRADPDPADDPVCSDPIREQIGRGEQYD